MIRSTRAGTHDPALGPGAEFDRIRGIARLLGSRAGELGDDCALIAEGDGFLALSTDVSVEGVHFQLDWIDLEEVGWRATAAALSDLAAEGATPLGVLAAVTVPVAAADSDLLKVMSGVGSAAEFAGGRVLGGDLSAGPIWSVAATVVGRTQSPVTRGGAQPGDGLWVTGELGGARLALDAWQRGEQPSTPARRRFAHPEPRINAGRWLAQHDAHAMIDLSDGIGGDACHLAAASAVALDIDLEKLPTVSGVVPEAERVGIPPGQYAAEAGEDYELLVALPASFDSQSAFTRECGIELTRIGTIMKGKRVRFLSEGREVEPKGFAHFG